MISLKKINVGVRVQATIAIMAMALWYISALGEVATMSVPHFRLWDFPFAVCPIIAVVFTVTSWLSSSRSGHRHGAWVGVAAAALISPLLIFLLGLLA